MRATFPRWRIPAGIVAILLLALAAASVEQRDIGWNEMSHLAQVRAFDSGTPRIDRWYQTTGDRAVYKGHYYSDKAPGLALWTLPVYRAVRSLRLQAPSNVPAALHWLVLWGCTLPFLVIMLLAHRLVEREDPGNGAVVAMMLGAGTLLLPFATMFFSHVLSACLGFAAFCLLEHERRRRRERATGDGLGLLAIGGALCGYAVGSEFPLAILAALLALYVAWRPSPIRALAAYAVGLCAGLIPLLAYDWWAFGSPLHLSSRVGSGQFARSARARAPEHARRARAAVRERRPVHRHSRLCGRDRGHFGAPPRGKARDGDRVGGGRRRLLHLQHLLLRAVRRLGSGATVPDHDAAVHGGAACRGLQAGANLDARARRRFGRDDDRGDHDHARAITSVVNEHVVDDARPRLLHRARDLDRRVLPVHRARGRDPHPRDPPAACDQARLRARGDRSRRAASLCARAPRRCSPTTGRGCRGAL